MARRHPNRYALLSALVGLALLGGLISPLSAGAARPSPKPKPSHSPKPSPSPSPSSSPSPPASPAWTTKVNQLTRDSFGNPVQASFTISGSVTSYAICIDTTSYPSYNTKAATYDTDTYGNYVPCKKFSWTSGTSNTQNFGYHFTFGGPATYRVTWYVPDVPANGGVEVGTTGSFKWANSSGTYSPCPPSPQLLIGVWRPSRFQVLNRCQTHTGANISTSVTTEELDQDRGWSISYSGSKRHVEYVMRDKSYLPTPATSSTWTIVGVYVCDTYHAWREFHPVFQATNSAGTTYLTGPQYSTATPTVTGTWSTKSCA